MAHVSGIREVCPHCRAYWDEIPEKGHDIMPDNRPCPEACSCLPECVSMAAHRAKVAPCIHGDTALVCGRCNYVEWRSGISIEKVRADRAESLLNNLLAVIHGDGGHYTGRHGIEKSTTDAVQVWASLKKDQIGRAH